MPTVLINNGGFAAVIPQTLEATGTDKGKVSGFGSSVAFSYCGVHKPTYKSQEESAASGENVEITTGTGVVLTAPKKTKKVSLVGATENSNASSVTDEYEVVILSDVQTNQQLFRGFERAGTSLILIAGYGYDQNNADQGFEALQCKVTEVSRGTAVNGENALTIKFKGTQIAWKSTVTHAALNTAVAAVGDNGSITPVGEEAVDLTEPSTRLFIADDVTDLQNGVIVPKN